MSGHENRPLSVLSTSFLLSFVGVAIYLSVLRAAEVYFTGAAWHAVGAGAFLGAALGWRSGALGRSLIRSTVLALLALGAFLLMPFVFLSIARSGPEPGAGLFCAIALWPLVIFYLLARFATVRRFEGDGRGVWAIAGGLLGAGAARLLYDFFLEGDLSGVTVLVAGLAGVGSWTLIRGAHLSESSAGADRPGPGAFPGGAFFLGAALGAVYPVTRKVLFQISPNFAGTDVAIFSIALGGALLGALFVLVLVPGGRWRFTVVLLGTVAFGASVCLLDRQLAFTQDIVRFGDFKRYFHALHAQYVPFMREEFLLYLAFLSIPAFAAGLALCAVRGAWTALLLGGGVGFFAGTGLLPWTGSASALVGQAVLLAAVGATLFVRAGLCLERKHFALPAKAVSVVAAAALWGCVVWGASTFAHGDYQDLPLQGEKDLLLFEASAENDLRVITDFADRANARLDTTYAYYRGLEWVARLVARMPSIVGLEGDCLLAGPLAPILAPLVDEAAGETAGGGRRFSTFETVPALRGASAAIAAHNGLKIVEESGSGEPISFFLLDGPPRFDNILLLPRFPKAAADRGRLSREIFGLVHDALGEAGTAWLFVDTTDIGPFGIAGVAAAFGDVFPQSSLWLLEDGLLPPYLLFIGLKGRDTLPGGPMAARIETMAAREGAARARFADFDDLSEYLIADRDGMQWLARKRGGAATAFRAVLSCGMTGKAPGWSAVDDFAKLIPGASLENVCAKKSGVEEWAMQARRFLLGGLSIHGEYTFAIDEKNDLDWELFRAEVGLYAEAFRAFPETALGPRIVAALMPMLIDANELQVVFETIQDVAGAEPDDVMLRYYLALASFKLLDFEEALGHFVALVEKDPLFVDGAVYAGLTSYALDKKEDALRYLERAHQLDEAREVVYKPLAICLFDSGRKEEAASFCLKALEIAPDDEEMKSLRMLIENRIILDETEGEKEGGAHEGHDHDHDHGG